MSQTPTLNTPYHTHLRELDRLAHQAKKSK